MEQIFVTSDHHFQRKSLTSRGHVFEYNRYLIEKWNSVVTKDDVVFHLGDFSKLGQWDTKNIVFELNGYKILIMGNHDQDKGGIKWWMDVGFDEVIGYPIILGEFYLSHQPLYTHKPYLNIHGHFHDPNQRFISVNHFNVCVTLWGDQPVNLNFIKESLNNETTK